MLSIDKGYVDNPASGCCESGQFSTCKNGFRHEALSLPPLSPAPAAGPGAPWEISPDRWPRGCLVSGLNLGQRRAKICFPCHAMPCPAKPSPAMPHLALQLPGNLSSNSRYLHLQKASRRCILAPSPSPWDSIQTPSQQPPDCFLGSF